jgi:hypothetical protein
VPDHTLSAVVPAPPPRTRSARSVVRDALRERMQKEGLSEFDVASEIEECRTVIAPEAASDRPLLSHDTIHHFLVEEEEGKSRRSRVLPRNVEIIRCYLVNCGALHDAELTFNRPATDFLFLALREFFGVNDRRMENAKAEMPGIYQFFMHSEDYPDGIVIGALRFELEPITGALAVTERQEKKENRRRGAPPAVVENWRGYAFPRSDRVIVVLQNRINRFPKFCIFHTAHKNEKGLVVDMQGQMIKLGGKGGGVFSSKILFTRDDRAFSKCDVVDRSKVDPELLRPL